MKKVKYYLSFFFEIVLQKVESQQSGTLTISLHKGELKLSTEKVIYSFGKNYSSFKYAFKKIKIEKFRVKNVLILGAGLGSIIQLLETNTGVENIIAVDNDEIIKPITQEKIDDLNAILKVKVVADDYLPKVDVNNGN